MERRQTILVPLSDMGSIYFSCTPVRISQSLNSTMFTINYRFFLHRPPP
jgi:hypothetical protein